MKTFFRKIGNFFCSIGKGIANGFKWMFSNKLVVMQILREVTVTLAPIVLFVAFPLHYLLKYLAKDSMIALKIGLGGCLLLAIYFILSAVYYLLKALDNKKLKQVEQEMKEKKEEAAQKYEEEKAERKNKALEIQEDAKVEKVEEKEPEKTAAEPKAPKNFFQKVFGFLSFNENTIKIVTSSICGVFGLVLFCFMFCDIEYWDIYYFYTLFLWCMFGYSVVELILSHNKKTAITMSIVDVALLVLLIIVTPKAHSMYFDLAAYTNTNEYDIYMLIISFIFMLPLRVGMANGYLEKTKRTRNVALGLLCLAAGIIMYYTPMVTKILNDSYIGVPVIERLYNQMIPYKAMGFVFIGVLVITTINISANLIHYFKKRNFLGIFDLACGVTGLVLACYAMNAMSNYLILFGR